MNRENSTSTVQHTTVGNMKALRRTNMTPQQKPEEMWKTLKRLMRYMEKIKSFNGEENAHKKFDAYNDAMYESGWKSKFFGGLTIPSMMVMQNIFYVFVAMVGAMKVAAGSIPRNFPDQSLNLGRYGMASCQQSPLPSVFLWCLMRRASLNTRKPLPMFRPTQK